MKDKVLVARQLFPETVERLRGFFDVEINANPWPYTREELATHGADKVGMLTNGTELVDAALLAACPKLRACANMAVGFNNFDVPACTAAGVVCTNTPDVLTETTADFGFALMMATARRMAEAEAMLRRGEWKYWTYDMMVGSDVHGATLGILGMGRIGQGVARRGHRGFGMNVIYHNRSRLDPAIEAECGARYVSRDELFRQSDHIVLVLPYSPQAHHTVGRDEFAAMKPTATITNIARGGLVDEDALADVLQDRRIAAAGLDVFEGEPKINPRLLTLPNVVLTPHIASATTRTRRAMAELAADNLIAALGAGPTPGRPPNPLNAEVLGRLRGQ